MENSTITCQSISFQNALVFRSKVYKITNKMICLKKMLLAFKASSFMFVFITNRYSRK